MALNVRIKPFRDYSEHEVYNLFAFDQASGDKGTVVEVSVGATNEDSLATSPIVPGNQYNNTVSNRWAVAARVTTSNTGSKFPLGIMLYDVREYDENGELLIFHPRKQAEMQAVLSGQAVPVLTNGQVLYSGNRLLFPNFNSGLYIAENGTLTTTGNANAIQVGKCLGPIDSHGYSLCSLNFPL